MNRQRIFKIWLVLMVIVFVNLLAIACNLPSFITGDTPKPTVVIVAPANGSQVPVNQSTAIQVVATDSQGVTRIEIKVDGALVGTAQSQTSQGQSSLTATQDWMFAQTGSHVITAQAFSAAGQASDLAAITVQVVTDASMQPTVANPPATNPTPANPPATNPTPANSPATDPTPANPPANKPTPAPVIKSFMASPTTITAGQSATLQWNVTGATQVGIEPGIGQVNTSGSKQVNPTTTTTYELTAWNPSGTVTQQVTVQVNQPPANEPTPAPVIKSFTANPATITAGQSATLQWDVTGATQVGIEPGVGQVNTSGSKQVKPTTTTTYELTAWNPSGTVTKKVTVQVNQPPAVAKTWSGWEKLGGSFPGAPTVASWSANRLDVFVRGNNTHLMHRWWNGNAWSGWEDLGGELTDSPACVSWAANRIDCFGRGKDTELWHKWWDGAKWGGWDKVGGSFQGAPTVASWSANRLDVFVRGNNTHLMHRWWNGSAWSGWEDLGGELTDSPGCVSWAANRIDCFGRGKDTELWHKWWDGAKWSGWEKLGGSFPGAPTVASWSANRLDVFVRGNNTHLMHRWWDGSAWSNWEDLGGELTGSPGCVSWAANRIDCFGRGNDTELWHKWYGN